MRLLSSQADRPCLVNSPGVHNALYQGEDSLDLGPLPQAGRKVKSAEKEGTKNDDRTRGTATRGQRAPADDNDRKYCHEKHDRIARAEDVASFYVDCPRSASFTDVPKEERFEAVSPGASKRK